MSYPTLEQVEIADIEQLCRWTRYLPSPGMSAINAKNFEPIVKKEADIMKRIMERQTELGGWTPEISKRIGWG